MKNNSAENCHYQKELADAVSRENILLKKYSLHIEIIPNSFSPYSVSARIVRKNNNIGTTIIYYSPKKKTHTARYTFQSEKDKEQFASLGKAGVGKNKTEAASATTEFCAYVDGSHIDGAIGYGVVILQQDIAVWEKNGIVEEPLYQSARQVAGELFAVGKTLQWCKHNSVKEITICYDYMGIKEWAVGSWKTNLDLTKRYAEFVRNSGIKIHWQKIAAHTGVYWNEYADSLAKNAIYHHNRLEQ